MEHYTPLVTWNIHTWLYRTLYALAPWNIIHPWLHGTYTPGYIEHYTPWLHGTLYTPGYMEHTHLVTSNIIRPGSMKHFTPLVIWNIVHPWLYGTLYNSDYMEHYKPLKYSPGHCCASGAACTSL